MLTPGRQGEPPAKQGTQPVPRAPQTATTALTLAPPLSGWALSTAQWGLSLVFCFRRLARGGVRTQKRLLNEWKSKGINYLRTPSLESEDLDLTVCLHT